MDLVRQIDVCYIQCMSTSERKNLLTETLPVAAGEVKQLLGQAKTPTGVRDKLIEVAGDRTKLVRLTEALNKIP